MWLHADFLHIFFNMIALLIVGPGGRGAAGQGRFLVLYLSPGSAAASAPYLLEPPNVAGIGASGAIMGVMGAYVVLGGCAASLPMAPVVALIVLNLLIGFTGNIDWRAHLGGLVTGARPGLRLRLRRELAGPERRAGASPSGPVRRRSALLAFLITGVAPGHVNWS